MATVNIYVKDSQGTAVQNALVLVKAIGAGNEPVYADGGTTLVKDAMEHTSSLGLADFTLTANASLIPPESYYKVTIKDIPNERKARTFNIQVPVGAGPFNVEDILHDPGTIETSALAAHIVHTAEDDDVHGSKTYTDQATRSTLDALQDVGLVEVETLVELADVPGATAIREQDDICYDPTAIAARRWKFYFSASFPTGIDQRIYVMLSADGETWDAPVECVMDAGAGNRRSQDPSVVKTSDGEVYRDGSSNMFVYVEDPATNGIYAYSSADGVNFTGLAGNPVIDNGAGGQWDANLVASPRATHDGTNFIIGYEGRTAPGVDDSLGIASGIAADSLTKLPTNPVWTPAADGWAERSIVVDAWVPGNGGLVLLAHSGTSDGRSVFRGFTTETNLLTWASGDIATMDGTGSIGRAERADITLDGRDPARVIQGNGSSFFKVYEFAPVHLFMENIHDREHTDADHTDGPNLKAGQAFRRYAPSGRYVKSFGTVTTASWSEAVMVGMPVTIADDGTLNQLAYEVTTPGSAGALVRLGIYNVDPSTGLPTSLVLDAGTTLSSGTDNTTNGTKTITISQALEAGEYVFCMAIQGGAGTRPTLRALTGDHPSVNGNTVTAAATAAWDKNGVSGALPATWGTPTTQSNGPRIQGKVA